MSIQLAYFLSEGCGVATYETGQQRQFFHGRTGTVRSFSKDSKAFTATMTCPSATQGILSFYGNSR